MKRRLLDRRNFLRAAGGTFVALPILSALRARAAPGPLPKRLVLVYSPNGVIHPEWFPSNTSETGFDLRPSLAPLAAHRDRMMIFKGIDIKTTAIGPGGPHQKGIGGLWTGRELQSGQFTDGCGSRAGWANGISVDQELVKHIGQSTLLPSLELGLRAITADVRARTVYAGPGSPLPPMNEPHAVFSRLFSNFQVPPDELEVIRDKRKSVLDAVQAQFASLDARIGTADRAKLDQHLELVRDVERRLDILPGDGKSCGIPVEPNVLDEDSEETMPLIADLHVDLLSMAFACDLTRIASLQFSSAINDIRMPFLGSMGTGHTLSHAGMSDTTSAAQRVDIAAWHSGVLAKLCDRLAAIPEGDGTVLDNTLIVWGNEVSWGNQHSHTDIPFVTIGSAGGYFKTGRYLEFPQVTHTRLLVSILNAMGVNVDRFGHPDYTDGPLAGLT